MNDQNQIDYHEWIKTNPAPDLQKLVATYGGYDKITPEAWTLFDQAREEWNLRRLERLGGPSVATREALSETEQIRSRPSRKKK